MRSPICSPGCSPTAIGPARARANTSTNPPETGAIVRPLTTNEGRAAARHSTMPSILAIDDDRAVLHLIERAVSSDDLRVHTARSAGAGLALAKAERPDAVLLDIM